MYHPDRNGGCPTAAAKFTEINEAYSVLGKKQSRLQYDRSLKVTLGSAFNSSALSVSQMRNQRRTGHMDFENAQFDFASYYEQHYGEDLAKQVRQSLVLIGTHNHAVTASQAHARRKREKQE